ncbi:MAG: hypothetical protein A3G39_08840 [Deltaproteobacteria bacterium RIFCSPLOWO2_12_FULL_43_16]|nr:MAG: hypothetical protein A3G39_08840 [Deltaproteobacteria bacterium RIFCSPLOWO2_12_FULL_43_16]
MACNIFKKGESMRQIRIVTLVFLFPLLISLSACGKSPEKARKELAQMNIKYTEENFWKHAEQGDSVVVKLFLNAGMGPNSKPANSDITPLDIAANNGHISTVQALLAGGANVNARSEGRNGSLKGMTPLMGAAQNGHVEIVKALLSKGADVNAKGYGDMANGITPLIMASKYGHTDIVKILLDKGADVNAKMLFLGKSETPLSNAEKEGHTEIVKLLKDAGAKE